MTIFTDEHYQDTGCFLHPSCLNCPRPICIEEIPGNSEKTQSRYQAIRQTYQGRDCTERELALMMGVSERTIRRALSN